MKGHYWNLPSRKTFSTDCKECIELTAFSQRTLPNNHKTVMDGGTSLDISLPCRTPLWQLPQSTWIALAKTLSKLHCSLSFFLLNQPLNILFSLTSDLQYGPQTLSANSCSLPFRLSLSIMYHIFLHFLLKQYLFNRTNDLMYASREHKCMVGYLSLCSRRV